MTDSRKRRSGKRSPRLRDARQPPLRLGDPARLAAILCPLIVGLTTFAAFWPALSGKFVHWDDYKLYVENPEYRGLDDRHLLWMFTTVKMGHYHPLTWLSVAIDYEISGMSPTSYHRTSLILHALNAVLVYFVALRLLAAAQRVKSVEHPVALRLAAAVAALLYAVHPLRVESVAWASERRDVLSLFFLLLALLAYLRAFEPDRAETRSPGWRAASWLLLLGSLLSKAWGMSFVLVVLILDVYPLRRLPAKVTEWWKAPYRPVWAQKLPYLVLGLAAAVMAGYAQRAGTIGTVKTLDEWGIGARLAQACYGLTFYIWKTIYPTCLAALYEIPYRMDELAPRYLASYVAVAGGVLLLVKLRRRWPGVIAASLVYVLMLLPVLGFVQSGPQLVADRYSYISCIGWPLLAGGGLLRLWRARGLDRWGKAGAAGAAGVLVVLFVLTYRQTAVWHDTRSLWTHAIAVGHRSAAAHSRYGTILRKQGRIDQSMEQYRAALELRPDYGYAWVNLGNGFFDKNDFAEAERCYRQALKFIYDKHSAYMNLGKLYYDSGRLGDAITSFRAAVEYVAAHPAAFSPKPYLLLGAALRENGDFDEARRLLKFARGFPETRRGAESELSALWLQQQSRP